MVATTASSYYTNDKYHVRIKNTTKNIKNKIITIKEKNELKRKTYPSGMSAPK